MTEIVVRRFPDRDSLAAAAAQEFADLVARAQAERGIARVVLTGGGAGIATLAALRDYTDRIDFSRIEIFWGDERFLPPQDGERNEVQARRALLDHVPVDIANVHPIPTDAGQFAGDVDAAADYYRGLLPADTDPQAPLFDVHLLGMGGEGHVNSIFPDTVEVAETAATVLPVRNCPKPPPTRITLTLPLVRRAAEVWMLVDGAEKSEAVAAALGGADPTDIPAAGATGMHRTVWFLGEDAAGDITGQD